MTHSEALDFIRPALPATPGSAPHWADLGAGTGTFTRALAQLLGRDATITALDNDRSALAKLRLLARSLDDDAANVDVVEADITTLTTIPGLSVVAFDGALVANVLHFFADPAPLVRAVVSTLKPRGRLVVIEYEGATANPWVPHPLSLDALATLAAALVLDPPVVAARRRSRYHGGMYCAVLERRSRQ